MVRVAGVVIARDEEKTLGRCLRSLQWAHELLVVVDARTVDATATVAAEQGARVCIRPFADFASQRNAALQMALSEWVLFVDGDEVVPAELAKEVQRVISSPLPAAGYWIPRRNILFGRWVRHAGWSPDYQLRLLHRTDATYQEDRLVHELVSLQGEAGYLSNSLVHYNYATLGEFLARQRYYATLEATNRFRQGVRIKPQNYLLQPWRQFWRRFVTLEGYREGLLGLLLSTLLGYYELITYLELRSLWRSQQE